MSKLNITLAAELREATVKIMAKKRKLRLSDSKVSFDLNVRSELFVEGLRKLIAQELAHVNRITGIEKTKLG